MTSEVYWAVLGLVIERPSYGLELYNRYQRVYADLLPVSGESHIYKGLDEMERRRLIETIPGVGMGRQPKPHYRATALGIRSFEDRCVERMGAQRRNQEMCVRQLAIFADNPETAVRLLGRFRREYLEAAGEIGSRRVGSRVDSRGAFIDELVDEQQRIEAGGMLSWLRFAIARFQECAGSIASNGPS